MSVTNPERVVTKQDLADFYDELLPFISPKSYAGFTPIGTIIPMIAESAPANYLICDGATYNKSDYPELAAHLLSMTSHSMYEVSGDATKFKVPDLQGQFLRGTGANSDTDEGSGSAVGVRQKATEHQRIMKGTSSNNRFTLYKNADENTDVQYIDKGLYPTYNGFYFDATAYTASGTVTAKYTSRPTNTSVLFCIATKNIYLDPKNDYSTEEKVIGTWINNEPLYQKTIDCGALPNNTAKNVSTGLSGINVVNLFGVAISSGYNLPLPYVGLDASASATDTSVREREIAVHYSVSNGQIIIRAYTDRSSFTSTYITIQYTKTS